MVHPAARAHTSTFAAYLSKTLQVNNIWVYSTAHEKGKINNYLMHML